MRLARNLFVRVLVMSGNDCEEVNSRMELPHGLLRKPYSLRSVIDGVAGFIEEFAPGTMLVLIPLIIPCIK